LDIQKDVGLNERFVTYLYALEVQQLVNSGQEEELQEVQEGYSIPEERAQLIIEAACRRYLDQLMNLAFRAAKKFDEKDANRWLLEIVKYSQYVSGIIDCDGSIFSAKDKERLISYLEAMELDKDLAEGEESIVDRMQRMINLTEAYVPPLSGIQGLIDGTINLNQLMVADPSENRKRWAWG
jgi:hypothetical protein